MASLCQGAPFIEASWRKHDVLIGGNAWVPHVTTLTTTQKTKLTLTHTTTSAPLAVTNTSRSSTVNLDGWRYFSAIECGESDDSICLFFKDHDGSSVTEQWVGGLVSQDGVAFSDGPWLVMPQEATFAGRSLVNGAYAVLHMTHNLGHLRHNGSYFVVGGQDNRKHGGRTNTGIWLARGRHWYFGERRTSVDQAPPSLSQWRRVKRVINGSHPGCIEARDWLPYLRLLPGQAESAKGRRGCEFDGRLSLSHVGGRFWLHLRSNPARRGQRFVQATSSVDTKVWSSFEPISLLDYRQEEGEIYFFASQSNPVHMSSLIALFPLVHRGSGCIAMAVSRDGLRWSRPTPLVQCETDRLSQPVGGDRAVHQPVSGMILRGDYVWLYVHEHVPGIAEMTATFQDATSASALPQTRLVRYDVPANALERWTKASLATLPDRPFELETPLSESLEVKQSSRPSSEMTRAAILLSGHLRDVCQDEAQLAVLTTELQQCKLYFGGCDVFWHTWSELEPAVDAKTGAVAATARPSSSCVDQIRKRIQPTRMVVERQEEVLQRLPIAVRNESWGSLKLPFVGFRMTIHGMLSAAKLSKVHTAEHGVGYHAAIRLRPDLGAQRLKNLGSGVSLSRKGYWSSVYRWATMAVQNEKGAGDVPQSTAMVHSCHETKLPGSVAGDICMWSAPAEPLIHSVEILWDMLDELVAHSHKADETFADCRLLRHPESALGCAFVRAGVSTGNMTGAHAGMLVGGNQGRKRAVRHANRFSSGASNVATVQSDECSSSSSSVHECSQEQGGVACHARPEISEDTDPTDELDAAFLSRPSQAIWTSLLISRGSTHGGLVPNSLYRPAKANSMFDVHSYLPSARYFCQQRSNRSLTALQERRRQETRRLRCALPLDATEAQGLLNYPNPGGVAKVLLYMSESAARGTDEGWSQQVPAGALWDFARGVTKCVSSGSFTCFFLPTLCEGERNSGPRSVATSTTLPPIESISWRQHVTWPDAAGRGMRVALALEERVFRGLQPWAEDRVQSILRADDIANSANSIGMHVRRGDACETFDYGAAYNGTRRCYQLSDYVKAARYLRSIYGSDYDTILLVTDSDEVLRDATANYRDFTWRFLRYDRTSVGGQQGVNLGTTNRKNRTYIEDRAAAGDPANELLVLSMIAELRFIAAADLFVGTSRSFVSVVAQSLIWARRGALPPTISLEGDPLHSLLHIRGRFWLSGEDMGWQPCMYSLRAPTPSKECSHAAAKNHRLWVRYRQSHTDLYSQATLKTAVRRLSTAEAPDDMRTKTAQVQAVLSRMFSRLEKSSSLQTLSATELASALTPRERCYASTKGGVDVGDVSELGCQQLLMEASNNKKGRCWPSRWPDQTALSPHEQPQLPHVPCNCWPPDAPELMTTACGNLPLWARGSLLRRHKRISAGTPNASSLVAALHGVSPRKPVVLIGDSVMQQVARAALCELARSGRHDLAPLISQWIDTAPARGRGGISFAARVEQIQKRLKQLSRGAIVVAMIGLHYGVDENAGRNTSNERRDRSDYATDVKLLINALQATAENPSFTVMVVSPPVTHFASSADGRYRASESGSIESVRSACVTKTRTLYGCSPRRPPQLTVPHGAPCEVLEKQAANSAARPPEDSPNVWRGEDLMTVSERLGPLVLRVPLHRLTSQWWDAHPGWSPSRWDGKPYATPTADCTHLCWGPFLFEPLWWAMRAATSTAPFSHESEI